jgi:uncharacterized protein (TIGR01777 family)
VIVTLTGATGFIGRALAGRLGAVGHQVHPFSLRSPQPLRACDAVIHLAGEPIAQRWSPEAKRRIRESRVEGTRRLIAGLSTLPAPPRVFICSAAVGFYGSRGDEVLTEASPPGTGFLADLCVEWERAAGEAGALGMRAVNLRTGMVLGRGGGALQRMLPAFRLGVGGRLGSGRQWMPWIHLDDLLDLVEFALAEAGVSGPLNAVAPEPVTNREFTSALARALHRPAFVPVPAFALRALFGEMASVLLASQRAIPSAALDAGFEFRHPELGPALQGILRSNR